MCLANVPDILHDTVQCAREQISIFIVVRKCDQKLGMTTILRRCAKPPTIFPCKLIRIGRHSRVAHVGKLFRLALSTIFWLYRVDNRSRDRIVNDPIALLQMHSALLAMCRRTLSLNPASFFRHIPRATLHHFRIGKTFLSELFQSHCALVLA